jgi:predicted enzyme related to lactoylglutathione lyase
MWFDLSAPNTGQAREFYSGLFGWAIAPSRNAGPYQAWITNGQQPGRASCKLMRRPTQAGCPTL